MQLPDAVSLVGLLLALAYFAIAWRVSRVVGTPDSSRIGVTLAIVLTGMLLAFAGYAESGGLLAVTALLWWSRVLAPLARPRDAVWLGVAWLLVLLSHRLGLVLLLPMLLRAFGPPIEGDRPMPRSLLTGLLVVIGVLGFAALLVGGGAVQLGRDARELLGTARSGGFRIAAPSDIVNTLWLVAPLALIDVPLAGWPAWLGFLRTPAARLATITAIPLVIGLVWLFPLGPSGLGAHRDWDANILLGVTLTVAAAQVLALAPPARLRAVVPWTVVLLALSALSWLAVNANQETSVSRALAVANRTSLPEAQRSHAYLFLGQRAMDVGDPAAAGAFYDRSFELNPNPRRALLAAAKRGPSRAIRTQRDARSARRGRAS
jgi:hypothetical protein